MSMSKDDSAFIPFDLLLQKLCEQELTAEEMSQLNQILAVDARARWRYLLMLELHGSLHWGRSGSLAAAAPLLEEDESIAPVPEESLGETMVLPALREEHVAHHEERLAPSPAPWKAPPPRRRWRPLWTAAAAVLVAACVLTFSYLLRPESPARLVAGIDSAWEGAAPQDHLEAGQTLKLSRGAVKLHFASGAYVIIDAPAEIVATAAKELSLRRGRATVLAGVESARGFVVRTPRATIVDVGTEFGVSADHSGTTEVHVFQGEITLSPNPLPSEPPNKTPALPRRITAGAGLRAKAADDVAPAAIDASQFVRVREFDAVADADKSTLEGKRLTHLFSLRRDPRVVALYAAAVEQKPQGAALPDLSMRSEHDGQLIGATWTEGRFGTPTALGFDRPDDRARVNIPGQHQKLTLAAWVYVERVGQDRAPFLPWSSLLMSDDYSTEGGYVHWQLKRTGALSLSVTRAISQPSFETRALLLDASKLSSWHHLAVTYDSPAGQVGFYFDGREVEVQPVENLGALTIGPAEIGNWAHKNDGLNARAFGGRVEELVIYSDALTAPEIEALYASGAP